MMAKKRKLAKKVDPVRVGDGWRSHASGIDVWLVWKVDDRFVYLISAWYECRTVSVDTFRRHYWRDSGVKPVWKRGFVIHQGKLLDVKAFTVKGRDIDRRFQDWCYVPGIGGVCGIKGNRSWGIHNTPKAAILQEMARIRDIVQRWTTSWSNLEKLLAEHTEPEA